jgi:transposase
MQNDDYRQLTDTEWIFVREELTKAGAACCRHPRLRSMIDALLWLGTYNTSWAGLPSRFPPHSTCYGAFYRWRLAGHIQPIFAALNASLPVAQAPGVKNRREEIPVAQPEFLWISSKID